MSSIQQLIQIYGQTNHSGYLQQIIEKIQTDDKIWVAYSPDTKNHYVDYVKGAPAVFIFSEAQFCEDFREYLSYSKIVIETMECQSDARGALFSDFYRSGIEMVVVDNGKTLLYLPLKDIAEKPDYSQLPPELVPVTNPKLVLNANHFYQAAAAGRDTAAIETVMMKEIGEGKYLLPLLNDTAAQSGHTLCKLRTGEGQILNIPAIKTKDGKNCIPVFTDWIELKRFDDKKMCSGNMITFQEIEHFCKGGAAVCVNPFGFSMILDRSVIDAIKGASATENDDITLFQLNTVPGEMVSALMEYLDKTAVVQKAYMCGIRKNGVSGYLIIADTSEGGDEKLADLPAMLSQYSSGVPITIVRYDTEFGRKAASATVPFYEKINM